MHQIDTDRLAALDGRDLTLLDVREAAEFALGHVPGARNIPMGLLPSRLDELDRSRPVHVICASGNRSEAMCRLLDSLGFTSVNVAGGTAAWARAGRELAGGAR